MINNATGLRKIAALLIPVFLFSTRPLLAQSEQWASKILGYSSEYRPGPYGKEYRAVQVLGRPNKLPGVGDSPCAWAPAQVNSINEEWIKVGFEKAIPLRQVAIAENFNAGAIVRVYAYDENSGEHLLIESSITPTRELGKMTYVFPFGFGAGSQRR